MEKIRIGLRIPYNLNTWLVLEAQKQGRTKNGLICQILYDWIKKEADRKEI